jgi:hypothetical protein
MRTVIVLLLVVYMALPCFASTTIEYSYDRQHRLVQASYSETEQVCYSYDAANNLDLEVSITEAKYLKSFLYLLSAVWPDRFEPDWLRKAKA